jgi:hypothetical protein
MSQRKLEQIKGHSMFLDRHNFTPSTNLFFLEVSLQRQPKLKRVTSELLSLCVCVLGRFEE